MTTTCTMYMYWFTCFYWYKYIYVDMYVPVHAHVRVDVCTVKAPACVAYAHRVVSAMGKKPAGESRTPTDIWAGLGFSKSMPDHAIREQLRTNNVKYEGPSMPTTYEVRQHRRTECCRAFTCSLVVLVHVHVA